MFVRSVWLEHADRARGAVERKTCVVGLTRFMCESELATSSPEIWKDALIVCLKILEEGDDGSSAVKDEDESLLELEQTGYEAGYSKLYFANVAPLDILAEFPAPKRYLAESIAKLSASRPGVVRARGCAERLRDG